MVILTVTSLNGTEVSLEFILASAACADKHTTTGAFRVLVCEV